jgi:hypothetical protein
MELPSGISMEKVLALIEKDNKTKEKYREIAQRPARKAYARAKAKEYYEQNKEVYSDRRKQYYEQNKETIRQKALDRYYKKKNALGNTPAVEA